MQLAKHQQGRSMTATTLFVVMLLTYIVIFMKMLPGYLEYLNVKSSMDSLVTEKNITDAPDAAKPRMIKKMLFNRFMVNDVKTVKLKDDVKLKREGNSIMVTADYTRQIHLFANIDVVLKFDHTVAIG